jgi:hypothetical protein
MPPFIIPILGLMAIVSRTLFPPVWNQISSSHPPYSSLSLVFLPPCPNKYYGASNASCVVITKATMIPVLTELTLEFCRKNSLGLHCLLYVHLQAWSFTLNALLFIIFVPKCLPRCCATKVLRRLWILHCFSCMILACYRTVIKKNWRYDLPLEYLSLNLRDIKLGDSEECIESQTNGSWHVGI